MLGWMFALDIRRQTSYVRLGWRRCCHILERKGAVSEWDDMLGMTRVSVIKKTKYLFCILRDKLVECLYQLVSIINW